MQRIGWQWFGTIMSTETLDDRLALVPVACRCPSCETDWDGEISRILLSLIATKAGEKVPVWCENCRAKPQPRATKTPPARPDAWVDLCPAEYRLESEGGQTDAKRLAKACGIRPDNQHTLYARAIRDLIQSETGPILLAGDPGTMKTRLAWRMVHAIWKKPATVRCMTSWQFQTQLQEASGEHRAAAWMRDMTNVALVFIDDLGKAEWTANTHGAFFELLESRISHRRPMLITTNESFADLKDARSAHKSAVAQSSAQAIIRRLREYGVTVLMQKPCK